MFRFVRPYLSIVLLFTLAVFPALPQAAPGRDHIVSAADLHRAVRATGEARQADLTKIERFLSTETARQALKKADLDPVRITQAVSVFSDEELSRLAALADKVQNDVVAGESAHRQILKYAIIGAATSILIWVIVTHKAT
ncbi:MAG: hypothetical protein DMG57_33325 [Acidobacteria bacterium]|nr:MAG: hypothetical protein DMG57_33325 [Acidobacteriota bacterium]